MTKAVVVLSGGQDSTTCLFWAAQQFGDEEVLAVTFDYRQRHRREIEAAIRVAGMAGVQHEVIWIGDCLKSTSPLTDPDMPLETYSSYEEMDQIIGSRVEKTFVPMRNAMFFTLAANRAACVGAKMLVTGVCQMDNANYPDCRDIFLRHQEWAINAALGNDKMLSPSNWIHIVAPLIWLSKAESVHFAQSLPGCMEALAYTHTAYDGTYPPVSKDHASVLRAQGFLEAGVPDPLVVRAWREGLMALPAASNYDEVRSS